MKRTIELLFSTILINRVYFLLGLMIVVIIIMSMISPYFLNVNNMLNMTRFGAVLALVAMGQSLVILGGGAGIDLSVGSMVSLSGVFFGLLVGTGMNIWAAAVLAVLSGGLLGAVNGITVGWFGVPPLIGTLGTMWAYGAIALVITRGVPVSGFPPAFGFLGEGRFLEIPAQILFVVLPVFLILQYVTTRTVFGRWIYLIGVNDEAAQFSGIPVVRVRFLLYTISGLLAGMGAIVMSSWLMTARPDVGLGMELQSITVAVLGGTYIFGGIGNLAGTILAVLIVTMVASGLQLGGINTIWQLSVLGFILLGAVALNQAITERTARRQGIRI